jgi:hypothetical protein
MDEKLPWRSAIHFVTVYSWQVHFSPHKSSHQGNNPAEKNSTAPHRRPVSHINPFSFGFERPKFNVLLNRAHIRRRPLSSRGRRRRMWPSVFLSLYVQRVSRPAVCVCVQMFILVLSPWLPQKVLDKIRGAERSIPQRSGADINRDNPARPTHQQRATSVNRRSTYYYYKQSSVELHQDSERKNPTNKQPRKIKVRINKVNHNV